MAKSDTVLHRIDLLLTLDYLLRYTDEKHPATQIKICEHATNFGLRYDKNNAAKSDVDRRRISDCLDYLYDLSQRFPHDVPFIIEKTSSGKYYVEQKFFLNETEILKVLEAIQNDKYLKQDETNELTEKLLDIFSNVHNRELLTKNLKKQNKGVRKINKITSRRLRLVTKALNERKLIKIRYIIFDDQVETFRDFWYRVYRIQEYRNKPYAILLPIDCGGITFAKNFIFDPVENLQIPTGLDSELLLEDFDEYRDLDALLLEKCPWLADVYANSRADLDMVKILIDGKEPPVVSFFFRTAFLPFVKSTFENYFSTDLKLTLCKDFEIDHDRDNRLKTPAIIPHPLHQGETPQYCVVNMKIDPQAFLSWLLTDVHGDGYVNISDMVTVVEPEIINERLLSFYRRHAEKMQKPKEIDA